MIKNGFNGIITQFTMIWPRTPCDLFLAFNPAIFHSLNTSALCFRIGLPSRTMQCCIKFSNPFNVSQFPRLLLLFNVFPAANMPSAILCRYFLRIFLAPSLDGGVVCPRILLTTFLEICSPNFWVFVRHYFP